MPDLVWTYPQLLAVLQLTLSVSGNKVSMYSSNTTPSKSSVFADFTIAVDPVNAAPLTWTLTAGSWTYSNDADGKKALYPQLGQLVNGTLNLYGYLVYTSGNVLIYAQRFDSAPFVLVSGLNPLIFVPEVHADSPGP